MRPLHAVCLLAILVTEMGLAQQNSAPLINQTASVASPISSAQADPKAQAKILDVYRKLPLSFEVNHGQTDGRVRFLSRTNGYTLFLTGDEAVLTLSGKKASRNEKKIVSNDRTLPSSVAESKTGGVLRMKLRDANPAAQVTGTDELAGKSNYFIGNNPAKWRKNVPTYAGVKYEGIYSGIDLIYYGNQRQLEYDFIVGPGADPHRIQFDVRGAKRIRRDGDGELVFKVGEREIRWHKPLVYQEKYGRRQEIAARYAITDIGRVGFRLAKYDASRPLYIDPLIYSTYLGGSGDDFGESIAVDSSGNAYVTGSSRSANFPLLNPLQEVYGGGSTDAFVVKINAAGSALVYSTYLGGSDIDSGGSISVDSAGDAYVTGYTYSTDFPTVNALQSSFGGGHSDAFVAEINPTGSALVYSTYLGGSGDDLGNGIAVDNSGNAYITGGAGPGFPVTMNVYQPTFGGGSLNAFVAKINSGGSALVYSTYLGGSGHDAGNGIAVDSSGNAYLCGNTNSSNFPTVNALQPTFGGGDNNGFVAKLNPTGSALIYSTYLGGSGADYITSIALDRQNHAYVTGQVSSTDFPITSGAFQTTCSQCANTYSTASVSELNAAGSALVYSTYLGGSVSDGGRAIAVDSSGNAYVAGETSSGDFPTTAGALQTSCGDATACGNGFGFLTKVNPTGSGLAYSTYLGGSSPGTCSTCFPYNSASGIALDTAGGVYVTGYTGSANFPTMNPLQPANAGGFDAFVAKIGNSMTTIASSSNPSAFGQSVTFTATVTSQGSGTPTGTVTFTYGSTTLCNVVPLSGATATCAYSALPVGSDSVTAAYSGDANFTPSSGIVSQSVTLQSQTISFPNPGAQTYGVAPIALSATATSGLPVSYAIAGPATVSGSTLVITGAGSVTVQAMQAGNNAWSAAAPVSATFTVNPATLTVTADNIAMSYVAQVPLFTFTASYSGFVNGDTNAVLTGAPAFLIFPSLPPYPAPVGSYPITVTQGTLTAANYTFTFVPGVLIITAAASPTLTLLNNYFVTGDHIVRSFDQGSRTTNNGFVYGTITMPSRITDPNEGIPDGADVVAAFLYWQALETTLSPSSASAFFNGYSITGSQVGNDLQSSCWTSGGSTPTMRAYRANVLPYLPVVNGSTQAVASHSVGVPANAYGTGNASLVIIYRVLSNLPSSYPLKATVIYDGNWSLEYAAGNPSSFIKTIKGFYDADASGSAKITDIIGSVVNNAGVGFSPATANGYTYPVSVLNDASGITMPNHYMLQAGQCMVWAATVFSTTVKNSDNDGLPNAWKTGPPSGDPNFGKPGYYDVRDNSWVDLTGAQPGHKDLFVQLDYMVGAEGSHYPSQDALNMVQTAFGKHSIFVHFVPGNQIPEDICTDDTTSNPPSLCMFPGEQGVVEKGVVAWKTGLEIIKAWPINPTSCASGGDCTPRFQPGRKDSYHYVLFGYSLALPTWTILDGTLLSIQVSGSQATVTTSAAIAPAQCTARVTIDGALATPNLNGVYPVMACPSPVNPAAFTIGNVNANFNAIVSDGTYPNTLAEPQLAIYSSTTDSTSGYSDLGGGDSAVTLGKWTPPQSQQILINEQAGTLMHELGHPFGLTHGGRYYPSNSTTPTFAHNCKPNYQSVMSYLFQVDLIQNNVNGTSSLVLDYSDRVLDALDENSLSTPGLTGPAGPAYSDTKWFSTSVPTTTNPKPVLSHCDGTPIGPNDYDKTMYEWEGAANPKNGSPITDPAWSHPPIDINYDGSISVLDGYSDWDNLDLRQIGASGNDAVSGVISMINGEWQVLLGGYSFEGGGGIRGAGGGGGGIRGAGGGGGGIRGAGGGGGGIRGAGGGGGGIRGAGGGGGGIRGAGGGGGGEADYRTIDSYARPPRGVTTNGGGVVNWEPATFGEIQAYIVERASNAGTSAIACVYVTSSPPASCPSNVTLQQAAADATTYSYADQQWSQYQNVTYYVTTVDLDPTNQSRESTPRLAYEDQGALTLNPQNPQNPPLTYNSSETLNISGGSTNGTVNYNLVSGPCTLIGAVLTANKGTGSCSVTATMAGNSTYYAVTSAPLTISLQPANATITVTPYNVVYDGNPHTATGSVIGVNGEPLSGLNLSGTTHTAVGVYNDTWSFTDNTGNYNNTSGPVGDTIKSWTANGFYPPVTMSTSNQTVWNAIKGGSTVPLKFNIYAASVQQTGVGAVQGGTVYVWSVACGNTGSISYATDYLQDTGATALRYDTIGGQFIQNWKSPKGANGCYVAIMTAADNATILQAYFTTN